MTAPGWYPPAVGDKLRRVSGSDSAGDALCHVMAAFPGKDDETLVVVAEWLAHKQRWAYEVIDDVKVTVGLYYRDGEPRPRR